jgi:hypothetical protein
MRVRDEKSCLLAADGIRVAAAALLERAIVFGGGCGGGSPPARPDEFIGNASACLLGATEFISQTFTAIKS